MGPDACGGQSVQLIGDSEVIRRLKARIPMVAKARRVTLVSGPTGVGKEVLARALHDQAYGSRAPYIPVHCGALPEHLVEAELFGHTRGAFTGATQARPGLVKSAANGTLFLDEIDSLTLPLQAKLLRFLETGEYRPVGSDRIDRSRAWILAATNSNLLEDVKEHRFREDLYYRLYVMHLELPALKLRGGDIEMLARHFLAKAGGRISAFSPCALRALHSHDWPGNVRELKHRVERAVLLSRSDEISAADLELNPVAAPVQDGSARQQSSLDDLVKLIDDKGLSLPQAINYCERALIAAALEAERGNKTRAARWLGIHVRTIFKKLRH